MPSPTPSNNAHRCVEIWSCRGNEFDGYWPRCSCDKILGPRDTVANAVNSLLEHVLESSRSYTREQLTEKQRARCIELLMVGAVMITYNREVAAARVLDNILAVLESMGFKEADHE